MLNRADTRATNMGYTHAYTASSKNKLSNGEAYPASQSQSTFSDVWVRLETRRAYHVTY